MRERENKNQLISSSLKYGEPTIFVRIILLMFILSAFSPQNQLHQPRPNLFLQPLKAFSKIIG